MLVLSPGSDGTWALTARSLAHERLPGRPIVILGACHAAETAPYLHEAWGLPLAFLRAGANGELDVFGLRWDIAAAMLATFLTAAILHHGDLLGFLDARPFEQSVRFLASENTDHLC